MAFETKSATNRGTVATPSDDEASTCDVGVIEDVTSDKNARATVFVKTSSIEELTFRPLDDNEDADDDSMTCLKANKLDDGPPTPNTPVRKSDQLKKTNVMSVSSEATPSFLLLRSCRRNEDHGDATLARLQDQTGSDRIPATLVGGFGRITPPLRGPRWR